MSIPFDNSNGDSNGEYSEHSCPQVYYTYKKKDASGNVVKEREPYRLLRIDNPTLYDGRLGHIGLREQKQSDEGIAVNGVLRKADGTFLHGFIFRDIWEDNA